MLDTETLTRIITALNPWHASGQAQLPGVPASERNLFRPIHQRLSSSEPPGEFRHEVIVGPRRTGKSTLLKQLANKLCLDSGIDPRKITYLSLDEMHGKVIALHQIAEFLVARSGATIADPMYLLIDEAAYADDWATSLKVFHDNAERYPVKVAATSSSALELHQGMIESGADRWQRRFLLPCQIAEQCRLAGMPIETGLAGTTMSEILASIPEGHKTTDANLDKLNKYKLFGGLPGNRALYSSDRAEQELLELYQRIRQLIQKIVTIDAASSYPQTNSETLARLFDALAEHPCGLINPGAMAGDLGVKKPTLEKYMKMLEDSLIMFRLDNWKGASKKRFFYDNVFPAAATFENYATMSSPAVGWQLENMVAAALNELPKHSLVGTRLYHLRKDQKEADFVLLDNREDSPILIEVGASSDHSREALRHLRDKFLKGKGEAYLVAPHVETSHSGDVKTIPLFEFLLAVERRKDYLIHS